MKFFLRDFDVDDFGVLRSASIWASIRLLALKKQPSPVRPPGRGFHLAFNASTHAAVDAFYSEALRAGGTDNGRPGLRLQYGPTYYAAFVIDPDGHPIEAVC